MARSENFVPGFSRRIIFGLQKEKVLKENLTFSCNVILHQKLQNRLLLRNSLMRSMFVVLSLCEFYILAELCEIV